MAALNVVSRLETVIVRKLVSHTYIKLRYDAVALPWLEPDEETVLEFHHPHRILALGRIDVETVIVKCFSEVVGDIVLVGLSEY